MSADLLMTTSETGASSTSDTPAATSPVNALPMVSDLGNYRRRLVLVYSALGAVVATAASGFVVLVVKPGHASDPSWSTWRPKAGSAANMTKQIADRIAAQYRLSEDGSQLVAVLSSTPKITSGSSEVAVKAIAIRKVPQSNAGIRIIEDTTKTRLYTLCGLGKNCSIDGGTASATRGRLTRREALETALYTFKFVPSVDSVIAFMPPAPGATTSSVLFLEKSALQEQLKQPLNKTLPLSTPPLPTAEDLAEAGTIDKLTLKNMFSYELTALQTGGAAIVLDPAA